jgi:hypothetical protein
MRLAAMRLGSMAFIFMNARFDAVRNRRLA